MLPRHLPCGRPLVWPCVATLDASIQRSAGLLVTLSPFIIPTALATCWTLAARWGAAVPAIMFMLFMMVVATLVRAEQLLPQHRLLPRTRGSLASNGRGSLVRGARLLIV